ncbi:hypothetical protein AVEN_235162-1 [Araneus ventricosus]|uniref:Uncharacterized protein n=1 Tax=Araneus ventricosus TaxID=182803 RepID=A0A4Y2H6Y2_ARAVE|nr:hypothetical protein AVEN_235162-1 [Araneus ventricosus]
MSDFKGFFSTNSLCGCRVERRAARIETPPTRSPLAIHRNSHDVLSALHLLLALLIGNLVCHCYPGLDVSKFVIAFAIDMDGREEHVKMRCVPLHFLLLLIDSDTERQGEQKLWGVKKPNSSKEEWCTKLLKTNEEEL